MYTAFDLIIGRETSVPGISLHLILVEKLKIDIYYSTIDINNHDL